MDVIEIDGASNNSVDQVEASAKSASLRPRSALTRSTLLMGAFDGCFQCSAEDA